MDAVEWPVVSELRPEAAPAVVALADRASASLNHAALSEHKRRELDHRAEQGPGAGSPGSDAAAEGLVVTDRPGGDPVAYAHVSGQPGGGQFAVEVVIDPQIGGGPGTPGAGALADALLDAVDLVVARRGGGTLRLWVARAREADDALALRHGFGPERDLIQMRCPLPLPDPPGGDAHRVDVHTRPFRPGRDEEAWLSTNNRAFASHPEQGHWTLDTLVEHEAEPWFDPDGFLVLEHEGRMAGSCWTKIHRSADPPMGEIYVIGVDPDFHGRGWGRALTRAGLEWLAAQGLTVGMLYVDAANVAAVTMYRSMGFSADHVDRAYLKAVDPS
jgi:mycothiol synthase